MLPQLYLSLALAILFAIVIDDALRRYLHRKHLRTLAHGWKMHFAPGDRLRLAQRIAHQLPIPGAANIRVRDLLFRTEDSRHHYLFTVDYTIGVIRGKVGLSLVAGFQEPVSRGNKTDPSPPILTLAPRDLAIPAAYQHIREQLKTIPAVKNEG